MAQDSSSPAIDAGDTVDYRDVDMGRAIALGGRRIFVRRDGPSY